MPVTVEYMKPNPILNHKKQIFRTVDLQNSEPTPFRVIWFGLLMLLLSGLHKCNTTTIQLQYKNNNSSCAVLVRTPAIQRCNTSFLQLAENLQATCSSCKKKLLSQLYCTCANRFTFAKGTRLRF